MLGVYMTLEEIKEIMATPEFERELEEWLDSLQVFELSNEMEEVKNEPSSES